MNFLIRGVLAILIGCGYIFSHVSAQSLNFSQPPRNRYTCSGDVATFLCSGVGDELIFYAPPFVNLSSPIQYIRKDNLGKGPFREPLAANLISTESPKMVAVLTVCGSVPKLTVHCIVRSLSTSVNRTAVYRIEGDLREVSSQQVNQIDGPNDFHLGTVEVSWNEASGDFIISHYTIELFVDDVIKWCISVSQDILSTRFSAPHGSIVHAKITVNSVCDRSTAGVSTKTIIVRISPSINAAIAFLVVLSSLGIAVGFIIGYNYEKWFEMLSSYCASCTKKSRKTKESS